MNPFLSIAACLVALLIPYIIYTIQNDLQSINPYMEKNTEASVITALDVQHGRKLLEDFEFLTVFYSVPFLVQCDEILSEFRNSSSLLNNLNKSKRFAFVHLNTDIDVDQMNSVERVFQVKRFPTIIIYRNGIETFRYEYNKYFRAIHLVDKLLNLLRVDVEVLTNEKETADFLKSHSAVMIGCFDSMKETKSNEFKAFAEAGKIKEIPFAAIFETKLCAMAYPQYDKNSKLPIMVVYRFVEDEYALYKYDKSNYEAIDAFVIHEQMPMITQLSLSTIHKVLGSPHNKYVILFKGKNNNNNDDHHLKSNLVALKEIARVYRGQGSGAPSFAYVNYNEKILRNLFGLSDSFSASIIMMAITRNSGSIGDGASQFNKYILNLKESAFEFTKSEISNFIEDVQSNKISLYHLSQRKDEAKQDMADLGLLTITANEYKGYIDNNINSNSNDIVAILLSSFTHPQFSNNTELLSFFSSIVTVASMNTDLNEIPLIESKNYLSLQNTPTIAFFYKNKNETNLQQSNLLAPFNKNKISSYISYIKHLNSKSNKEKDREAKEAKDMEEIFMTVLKEREKGSVDIFSGFYSTIEVQNQDTEMLERSKFPFLSGDLWAGSFVCEEKEIDVEISIDDFGVSISYLNVALGFEGKYKSNVNVNKMGIFTFSESTEWTYASYFDDKVSAPLLKGFVYYKEKEISLIGYIDKCSSFFSLTLEK